MDQEREDYADPEPTGRRRGSPLVQLIIIVAIVLLALPMIAGALFWGGGMLLGGFEDH